MADVTRAREIAADLQSARDLAGRLAGVTYVSQVEPWRNFVRNFARARSISPLEVPLHLDRNGDLPKNPLWLFAAVVDVTEEVRNG